MKSGAALAAATSNNATFQSPAVSRFSCRDFRFGRLGLVAFFPVGLRNFISSRGFGGVSEKPFHGAFKFGVCVHEVTMPRQKLPPNLYEGPWGFGPFLVGWERPELSKLIGDCMTVWPAVSHQMALILGVLLGADNEAAVAVFATLQNARARRDALSAVAQVKLNERQQELFEAVLVTVGYAEKERNNLAHGCYGTSASIPDGILWIESKRFGPWNISTILRETQITSSDYRDLAKHIFVYKKQDLVDVYKRLTDAFTLTWEFLDYVSHPAPAGPTDDARFHQLYSSPRIARALAQIRQGKKNNPEPHE